MLDQNQFLEVIRESFRAYLYSHSSRSTLKLKALHGCIANDLQKQLGQKYEIKSQGYGNGKEEEIGGRYYPKKVDITISLEGKPIAGIAVKFVMRNYSQNSNNYFENMLGETANLRANSIPYFQIFIIFDKIPYFKADKKFRNYEEISKRKLEKYILLSNDQVERFYHTPDKTLIVVIHLKDKKGSEDFKDVDDYMNYYLKIIDDKDLLSYSTEIEDDFGKNVILNNYSDFITRCCYKILSEQKETV